MESCAACNQKIKPSLKLKCVTCKKAFHHDCLNIHHENFISLTKSNWNCSFCTNISRRKRGNLNSPVQNTTLNESNNDTLNMSCDDHNLSLMNPVQPSCGSSGFGNPITLEQISHLLDTKMEIMRVNLAHDINIAVKKEIGSVVDVLKSEFTATTDFLCAEQNDLKVKINAADDKITDLSTQSMTIQNDLLALKAQVESYERLSRSCNVEIQAVPETRNENVVDIVRNLCGVIKTTFNENEISNCRRVAKIDASSTRPRNILLTLPSSRQRDMLLSAVKRFNKMQPNDTLNSTHLGVKGDKSSVYVAEHLSPDLKKLHANTRKTAKAKGYKFVN
ncbi:hypothetical protein ACJJTC_004606 [Scirpophaga incertulas]